ncbi:hypothetical protein QBC47DRAFT_86388 [Echria macrotheca]|uniref:LsmAD domain-containing protein n=1 Tax=Echria macrotheca TaxID=438768 RepID=A0AAJ0B3W7_9PEZI|nr:hypothetical protein QBC47DRAFT_86388 [Echria macrotheca]
MVEQKKLPNSAEINGAARREQPMMSFQKKEIVDACVLTGNATKMDGKNPNGNRSTFRTDAAISDSRTGPNRELKRWQPDSNDTKALPQDVSMSLTSSGGGWDQFAENERLFGLKTDYDENIYTTTIDKSHPQYQQRVAAAEKKAREIERSTAMSSHVAEERVMDFAGGADAQDEEDKYSGVRRQAQQQQDFPPLSARDNKYTPPARRAPTGQATVKGAPVDPAIISSQLKAAPSKQPTPKIDEPKNAMQAGKPPATPVPETKPAEVKPTEAKETKETQAAAEKPSEDKASDKGTTPSAGTSRIATPKETAAVPSATATVEKAVLNSFKTFATQQRQAAKEARSVKTKQDKEVKLNELKNFASSFKLSTPVPKDLIGIIAKDPAKQLAIQEKAQRHVEEMKEKAAEAAKKAQEAAAAKDSPAKAASEQPTPAASAPAVDNRGAPRPATQQHTNTPGSVPGRHSGPRTAYSTQPHYAQQYGRNNRPPAHMAVPQNQQTGNLAQRLRNLDPQQKLQHMSPHTQHVGPVPTGPAGGADPSYGRRASNIQSGFMANKLNPNSHEFRPNPQFAQPFIPAGPSQQSSPRGSVNNMVEPTVPPTPVPGQLIRRKTKAVDVKKCMILSHIQTIQPPVQGRNWDHNDGLRPSWDTLPTWLQLKDDVDDPSSATYLTYKDALDQMAQTQSQAATPNPSHVMPQAPPHMPFHLHHGGQNLAPRQSPHPPPMQMHTGQHGHGPQVPFSNPDDHRMMHSNSAQSYASPRMAPVTMYAPNMNSPAQMPYGQPPLQTYIQPGAPQMGQYRSFSNTGYMPQPSHIGNPMLLPPQFMSGPNGMVPGVPQVPIYPNHSGFMPPGPPQQPTIPGSNGYPSSPGRPVAAMMAHQGSHQGQHFGMSPGMHYQQPVFNPQQGGGKFPGQRPQ